MSRSRHRLPYRLLWLVVAAALALPGAVEVWAQTQPDTPAPAAETAPASPPAAATPTPADTPPAAPPPADATPTAPAAEDKTVDKATAADPFGEEVTLEPRTVVMLTGNATWEAAFETLIGSFKKLVATLDKQNISPSGPFIVVYTATDDAGFTYFTEIPVDSEPKGELKGLPDGITLGKSPEGKMLKFVHRGSYDNMDNTYEAITNHLDERRLEARDMFIEEYVTDPLKTAEDKLVINVLVPLK
ncbi:MAG: GyrI-like domain-containing protein [Xanthobacteraceae bacterium]